MIEIWKDIKGYEGQYQVSNLGNVRSLDRIVLKSNGKAENRAGKAISIQYTDHLRYKYVMLYKNGKGRRHWLHRLIYESFVDTISEGMVIDHINNDRFDNRIENLQCITIRENSSKDTKASKNGKLLGAFKERYEGWASKIWIDGRQVRIGTYKTEEEAHEAYLKKLKELEYAI